MNRTRRIATNIALCSTILTPGLAACKPVAPAETTVVVRAGDSFYRIANRLGVDPQDLAEANGMTFESVIHPGDVLVVPGATQHAPPTTRKPSTPTTRKPTTPTTRKPSVTTSTLLKPLGHPGTYALDAAQRAKLVKLGLSKVGSRYVLGDEGPKTFDCSGFVNWLYNQVDSPLPRETAADYSRRVTKVSLSALKPGDLVFFFNSSGKIGHVGINIGGGEMVHASNRNTGVIVSKFTSRKNIAWAGRL